MCQEANREEKKERSGRLNAVRPVCAIGFQNMLVCMFVCSSMYITNTVM